MTFEVTWNVNINTKLCWTEISRDSFGFDSGFYSPVGQICRHLSGRPNTFSVHFSEKAETTCPALSFQVRVLHFNLRHGPENYELRTCSVRAYTVELFCTWRAFLALLCEHFAYRTSQGFTNPRLCNPRQNRLRLEWVPRPEELPQEQYDKQRYRGLTFCSPDSTPSDDIMNAHQSRWEITDIPGFVEELLKVSLAEGFKVDLVTPNPAEILNCTSLRLVKCWTSVMPHPW